jgi:hypothetical protein
MINVAVPLLLAFIISIAEYFSKSLNLDEKGYHRRIISFTAGVSITYILLELIPIFAEGALALQKPLFLALLLGFISHHIIEKEIYKHNRSHELIKKLSSAENIFYFIYHIVLGIVLVTLINQDFAEGIFFFVSIFAYTLASNLAADPHISTKRMIALSSSTLIGAILGTFIWKIIAGTIEIALIGFVAGVLLFTVTRHHIPYGRKGQLVYFVLGFGIYTLFIATRWI